MKGDEVGSMTFNIKGLTGIAASLTHEG